MRFPGCEQGFQGSRHQFADRRSGGERTRSQTLDQAARKPHGKDVLAVGDGHGRAQLLGFAQVAVGLASRDGELAGEAFDSVRQVRAPQQQRAGEIEPLGLLGIADAGHTTYTINSTCLISSLVTDLADALEREVSFCVGGVKTPARMTSPVYSVIYKYLAQNSPKSDRPRARNAGWVNGGMDRDTAVCLGESIRHLWRSMGRPVHKPNSRPVTGSKMACWNCSWR